MLYHKKYFVVSAISAYLVLLTLFFWPKTSCSGDGLCVRFCCKFKEFCEKTTKPYLSPKGKFEVFRNINGTDKPYTMKFGAPDCALSDDEDNFNWTIDDVSLSISSMIQFKSIQLVKVLCLSRDA
jgi:hypothetical protein